MNPEELEEPPGNQRRLELIEKKHQGGGLTAEEEIELKSLHEQVIQFIEALPSRFDEKQFSALQAVYDQIVGGDSETNT